MNECQTFPSHSAMPAFVCNANKQVLAKANMLSDIHQNFCRRNSFEVMLVR